MALVGTCVAVAVSATSAPAAAAPPASAALAPDSLADGIAAPWPRFQRTDGSFADYMDALPSAPRDRYGTAAMGHALLQSGLRSGDSRLVDAGLRGLVRAAEDVQSYHSIAFEQAALAAGYNLARRRAGGNPIFILGRQTLERRLRTMRSIRLGRGGNYFNQFLVDALVILELERSGLRSGVPGTILNDLDSWVGAAEQLLNQELLEYTRGQTARTGRAGLTTLATDGPLAYHVLTLAYTGRALRMLGDRASPAGLGLVQRYARATWAFAGPDGDVSYFGRSQQQSWVLAMTAYGMELAAAEADRKWAPRFRAVAARALSRLKAVHAGGPFGVHLTPAFARDPAAAMRAQDAYVSGSAYTGLTLNGLEWLAAGRRRGRIGRLAADDPVAFRLGARGGAFTVVSTDQVWYVVRQRPGKLADLRSGAGLIALKVRGARGVWRDALGQRPLTLPPRTGGGEDSAGPVLKRAGATGLPYGRDLSIGSGGAVRWLVDFRLPGYGALLRKATVTIKPTPCGVRMTVPSRRGDRYATSVFLPSRPRPRLDGPRAIEGGNLRAGRSGRGHISVGRTYFSASAGRVVRTRLSSHSPRPPDVDHTRPSPRSSPGSDVGRTRPSPRRSRGSVSFSFDGRKPCSRR